MVLSAEPEAKYVLQGEIAHYGSKTCCEQTYSMLYALTRDLAMKGVD